MTENIIPFSYIEQQKPIDWPEAIWAIRHGYLIIEYIPEIAKYRLQGVSEDWNEIELLDAKKVSAYIVAIAEELARNGQEIDEDYLLKKWSYIFLRYIYETKNYSDYVKISEEFYYSNSCPEFLANIFKHYPIFMSKEKIRADAKRSIEEYIKKYENVYFSKNIDFK